jgi:hypothetical protein
MNHERYVVVFDTNSYPNLVLDKPIEEVKGFIAKLKRKEASKNIVAYATPVVGMEMLANLAGPGKGLHYDDCLKGLVAMANHCIDETNNMIHAIPHQLLHIAQNFFGVTVPGVELISKNMALVIADFRDEYVKAAEGHELKGTFTDLKKYVDDEERRWVHEINDYINGVRTEVRKKRPSLGPRQEQIKMLEYIDSGLFVPFVAMKIIFSIGQFLQMPMTGDEHTYKGYMLPRVFPFSVLFYQWICHRIVEDKIDMENKRSRDTRWNWRWDYEVSFLINDHPIANRQLFLVTSDGDMTKMLHQYGYNGRVMDLDKYLGFLDWKER